MQLHEGTTQDRPPAEPVEWRVSSGRRSVRVKHQLWFSARLLGAAALCVPVDQVKCVRLDERRLPSSRKA